MDEPVALRIPATGGGAGRATWGLPRQARADSAPRILVGGDFCPGVALPLGSAWATADEGTDAPLLPSLTRLVDFSIVNLECPLGQGAAGPKSGPRLHADPAWATVLAASGIDAVSLANNHAMDQGAVGLASTIEAASDAGLRHVGAGRDLDEAARALLVQVRERTVAVLAFAEHEFGIAARDSAGTSPLSPETALRLIRSARDASDTVVVLVHGGNEAFAPPRPGLRDTCRFLVDCGADAVLCGHSHTIGPMEWYAGAPIVYGLGNLYFPWRAKTHPDGWHESLCVVLELGASIGVNLVPARFTEDRQGVHALPGADAAVLMRDVESLSALLADDAALERAWSGFVHEHRRDYLGMLLGLSRLERAALRSGIWPSWRIPRRRLPELLNAVRCESHREALLRLLEGETRRS